MRPEEWLPRGRPPCFCCRWISLIRGFAEGDTLEALEDIAFGGRNVDYPYESLSAYYDRASYGKLQIRGQAFAYTASHERSWYESNGIQSLFQETLAALDEEIDYTQFDGNGGRMDRWGLSALCRGAYWLGKYLVEHDLRKLVRTIL